MDVHTFIQREQRTELSSDIWLDLLTELNSSLKKKGLTINKNIYKCGKIEGERFTNLSVTANFDWLVFVPGVGQVSRFSERKLPPGEKK